MTDIKLDTATHDLVIENQDIQLFSTIQNLTVQKVKINLLNFRGEWFRDINTGVPYLQDIFGKRDTQGVADTLIKNAILDTDNIVSITSYQSTITEERKLTVIFSATTNSGDILNNITLEI